MLGGRLLETENKRICQISGLKSGRGSDRLREFLEQYLTEKQNVFYKVVAFWRVDCTSKITNVQR